MGRRSRGAADVEGLAFVVDQMPVGIVLIDRALQVAWMNSSAHLLIQKCDGIALRDGRLAAASDEQDDALARLMRAAVDATEAGAPRAPEAIAVSRSKGSAALVLVVRPIETPEGHRASDAAHAVVFISDPDRSLRASRMRLQQLFGLTPAEANLVALLATGHDLSEAASVLGVRKESLRTYLKRAFEKTGTHRQAELVYVALAAATAGAVEP